MGSGVISGIHLGVPVVDCDGRLVIYAEAHEDLTAYQPYVIVPSLNTDIDKHAFISGGGLPGTAAANDGKAITAAPGTLAVDRYIGVPQQAYDDGDIAKLVIGGACKMLLNGDFSTNVYVEVITTGTYGIPDASAQGVGSMGYCCNQANIATTAATNVQLLGLPVQVAGS